MTTELERRGKETVMEPVWSATKHSNYDLEKDLRRFDSSTDSFRQQSWRQDEMWNMRLGRRERSDYDRYMRNKHQVSSQDGLNAAHTAAANGADNVDAAVKKSVLEKLGIDKVVDKAIVKPVKTVANKVFVQPANAVGEHAGKHPWAYAIGTGGAIFALLFGGTCGVYQVQAAKYHKDRDADYRKCDADEDAGRPVDPKLGKRDLSNSEDLNVVSRKGKGISFSFSFKPKPKKSSTTTTTTSSSGGGSPRRDQYKAHCKKPHSARYAPRNQKCKDLKKTHEPEDD